MIENNRCFMCKPGHGNWFKCDIMKHWTNHSFWKSEGWSYNSWRQLQCPKYYSAIVTKQKVFSFVRQYRKCISFLNHRTASWWAFPLKEGMCTGQLKWWPRVTWLATSQLVWDGDINGEGWHIIEYKPDNLLSSALQWNPWRQIIGSEINLRKASTPISGQ